MRPTHRCLGRLAVSLAVFPLLLAMGGAAAARAGDDQTDQPAATPPPPPPATEPTAAPAAAPRPTDASAAATPLAPSFEQMGPATYPGTSRGLAGGSLWLEPSFHGLQWPLLSRTGIGVSGGFWIDSGQETITRNLAMPPTPNSSILFMQGRGLLRVTPTYVRDNLFIQGQAELVGNLCQGANDTAGICPYAGTFTTDDLWIRVGQRNLWDLKIGRFEGWEIYHLGMGLDPHTIERAGAGMFGVPSNTNPALEAPSVYAVNYLHDRPTEGMAVGHAAAHLYATDNLRFEVLGKLGSNKYRADKVDGGGTAYRYLGMRPTAILDLGWLKLKLGGEYQKRSGVTQTNEPGNPPSKKDPVESRVNMGLGGSLQLVFAPVVELGLNAAIGQQQETNTMGQDVPENSFTTKSFGGFANVRLAAGWLAGGGANWTEQLDKLKASDNSPNDYTAHLQSFAALQYLLAGQLYIKAVFSFAQAKFQASDSTIPVWKNNLYGARLRLAYLY